MDTETVAFGGGCFWCTEAVFTMLKGVVSVEPGYAGGSVKNPTYEEVSRGNTGHAEVVRVTYDPEQVAFAELLQVFFSSHDPTTLNRQGNDVGTQYRSAIFYTTESQKQKAEHYIAVLNKSQGVQKIVTEVAPLAVFYPAEDYHKEYFANNPQAGYCQLVIAPKVEKVGEKFRSLLKE
jgi:peptide-methionine (S)-S-oxide reductase